MRSMVVCCNIRRFDLIKASLELSELTRSANERSVTSSRYLGVTWCAQTSSWRADVSYNRTRMFVGYFEGEEEAARERDLELLRMVQEADVRESGLNLVCYPMDCHSRRINLNLIHSVYAFLRLAHGRASARLSTDSTFHRKNC
jgi:hypothetical protein